jgi:hypothetical protein
MKSTYGFSYAKTSQMFATSLQLNAFIKVRYRRVTRSGDICHSVPEIIKRLVSVTFCTEDSVLQGY